ATSSYLIRMKPLELLLQQVRAVLPAETTLRPVQPDVDAAALVELVNADSAHVGNPFRDSVEDMMEVLTSSDIDVARDSLIAVAPDGSAIGWAFANRITDPKKPRVFLFGRVHPAFQGRGIGRALLRWSKARAEEILDGHPGGTVQVQNFEGDLRARRLCESEGARAIRWFAEMVHTFANTKEEIALPLPTGLRVVPYGEVDAEKQRLLHNHCFADHWGSSAYTEATWRERIDSYTVRMAASEAIVDERGSPVAYQISEEFPQDAETLGNLRWLATLGVHRDYRGKGLATHLILRHLSQARREGFEGSMLAVDSDSLTGANALYERLGYTRRQSSVRYIFGDAEFS
ncbi:MAG: GNAT family N-acetyltransferase, partial [Candidatus Limnocylindrus sp.]